MTHHDEDDQPVPSIQGEVYGYRYAVESHAVSPGRVDQESTTHDVTFTKLVVSWNPDDHTLIQATIDSGTLSAVFTPEEADPDGTISDWEYTFSNHPQGLDEPAQEDVARDILESLDLGKF